MSVTRTFKFLTVATVLVKIDASDEAAARAAFESASGEEIRLDATTREGHRVNELHLMDDSPELVEADDVEPVADCPQNGCGGHLVGGRCTGDTRDADTATDNPTGVPGQRDRTL